MKQPNYRRYKLRLQKQIAKEVHDHPQLTQSQARKVAGQELNIQDAMKHKNKLGEGAKHRAGLSPDEKFKVVMREYNRGTLHSSDGQIVTDRDQALAIAFSEKRKQKKVHRTFLQNYYRGLRTAGQTTTSALGVRPIYDIGEKIPLTTPYNIRKLSEKADKKAK